MRAFTLALAVALAAPAAFAAPSLTVGMIEARTHPDSRWFGENAYHFRLVNLKATELDGQSITWNVTVKRKLAPWKTAKSWFMETQKVASGTPRDVAFALLYRNLAKAKFQPGEHIAVFIATTANGKEVFRNEIAFNLPGNGVNAFRPADFVNKKK